MKDSREFECKLNSMVGGKVKIITKLKPYDTPNLHIAKALGISVGNV